MVGRPHYLRRRIASPWRICVTSTDPSPESVDPVRFPHLKCILAEKQCTEPYLDGSADRVGSDG